MDPAKGRGQGWRWSGELVIPLLIVAYCLSYVWQTSDLPGSATIWPYALIGILALLLLVLVAQSRLRRIREPDGRPAPTPEEAVAAAAGTEPEEDISAATTARQIAFCAATLLFVPLVSAAGFLVAGTLYLFVLSVLFGTVRWYVALPGAFAISLGLAYLMVRALQIMFPTGWLDRLLVGA